MFGVTTLLSESPLRQANCTCCCNTLHLRNVYNSSVPRLTPGTAYAKGVDAGGCRRKCKASN